MTINLRKGGPTVNLDKTATMTASLSWPAATDYDEYAAILLANGKTVYVATFGARGVEPLLSGWGITHSGDVARIPGAPMAVETLAFDSIHPDVLAIVPVAYSAQGNGMGSFKRYGVSMRVENMAGQAVAMEAEDASSDERVYSYTPAILHNQPGLLAIEPLEAYSPQNNENRARLFLRFGKVRVSWDGPRNNYK